MTDLPEYKFPSISLLSDYREERFEEPAVGTVWISEKEMTRFGIDRNTEELRQHYIMGRSIGGIIGDFAPNDVLNYDSGTGSYVKIGRSEEQYGLLIETTGDKREARKSLYGLYRDLCVERNGIEDKPYMFGYIPEIISEELTEVKDRLSLVRLFMLLSLLLSALGLIAMSGYYADENSRDIAVRKVFGSSTAEILQMFNKRYLYILLGCFVVAAPVGYLLGQHWLEGFAVKTAISPLLFLVSFLLIALITMLTVTYQSWKNASENPVNSIKTE